MALLKSQGRGHGVVEVEGAGSLSVGQRPIGEVWSTAERTTPLRLSGYPGAVCRSTRSTQSDVTAAVTGP